MTKIIQFDRIENDRMYLGFTEAEIFEILNLLEEHRPHEDLTNRLDALAMVFLKEKRKRE